jgi:hypothetical protein
MNKAISTRDLITRNFNELPFSDEWLELIGTPEVRGTWIIWGSSTNGKTRFALQLAKYLSNFGKVVYNSLEEGASKSMKDAIIDINMLEVGANFNILDMEDIAELKERLKKDVKIKFVFIDSLQYSGLNYNDYKELKKEFPKKLFIYISHAEGKEPSGAVARAIRYDAFVKIWIEGFKAFAQSRYGGGEPFTIWQKGAEKYWLE